MSSDNLAFKNNSRPVRSHLDLDHLINGYSEEQYSQKTKLYSNYLIEDIILHPGTNSCWNNSVQPTLSERVLNTIECQDEEDIGQRIY